MMSAEVDKKEEEKEEDNEEKKDPSKDGVIVEPNKDETVRLRRVLSVWDASAYIVCSIIGSGIFISPKGVILRTGSGATALLMWAATGGINLVVAFCYAELALTFPETGSEYTYIRKAFGEAPAFLLMWVLFVFQHGCAKAILALTFATYFGQMFWTGCPSPEVFKKLVAALALTVLTAIGCYSSRWAVRLSDFFTAAKLVGLALIVVTGLGYAALEDASLLEWHNFSRDSSSDVADYALAYYAALWAYGGLQNAINVVEELKEPVTSNVLRSITISQLTILFVYLATNLSYLIVLTSAEIVASDAVAMTFGERIFSGLFWIMPFFVSCSVIGTINNSIMNTSRFYLAGTRQRHLPRPLGLLHHEYMTPVPLLIVQMVLAIVFLSTSVVYDLMLYSTYISVLAFFATISALVYLRVRRKDLIRPFQVPLLLPILLLVILIGLLIFPIFDKPFATGLCFAFLFSGVPVYFILIYPEKKIQWLLKFEASCTRLMQKLVCGLPEELDREDKRRTEKEKSESGVENPAFEKKEE